MVRPMRKTRAPTQSQRAIGHIAALQSIATMFVMHAMVGRSTLQFKMPRLDAYHLTTPLRVSIRYSIGSELRLGRRLSACSVQRVLIRGLCLLFCMVLLGLHIAKLLLSLFTPNWCLYCVNLHQIADVMQRGLIGQINIIYAKDLELQWNDLHGLQVEVPATAQHIWIN